jgi:phage tail-like protein
MYYPPVGFLFRVEFLGLDGVTDNDVRFQSVSGISADIGTEDLREGGENRYVQKLPQSAKYPNLILKRGLLTDSGLIKWFEDAVQNFDFKPITIQVSLLNEEIEPLVNWKFVNAYPVKWEISSLDSVRNEVVVDTIEIAYQFYTKS